jgi:cereblon
MESDDVSENQQENLESTSRQSSTDQQRSAASRTRRLVSQSTFQENDLDNPELNSQRQFLDISSSNSSIDSECDDDEMFEEYLRQRTEAAQTQATPFDDELPMHHSYLGENMDIVRGTTIFEAGKIYELPICAHHTMVFPGEILPMILISESLFGRSNADSDGGLIFGCVFPDEMLNKKIYGVTCQVFERGIDNNGHITVKSKARQRFMLVKTEEGYTTMRNNNHYAKVKILPEYLLPDPISLTITNNSKKFLQTPSYQQKLKNLLASSTQIPRWIYDRYSIVHTNDKVERFLAMLALSSPQDPILKSFWLARNVPLNPTDRMKIFASNCVNHRMIMIGDSLNFVRCLIYN